MSEKQAIGKITPTKIPVTSIKPHKDSDSDAEQDVGPRGVWKFFAAFAIVLVVLVGYFWFTHHQAQTQVQQNSYNGFDFTPTSSGFWAVRIQRGAQPYDIEFHFHPRDTLSVLIDPNATAPILQGAPKVIYLSFDPDAGSTPVVAGVDISKITGSKYNILNIETHGALSRPTNDTKADLPIVNCRDANPDAVVIAFVQGTKDLIVPSKNPSCIILQYTDANESLRVADRYAYMLLRVMH